VIDSDIKDTHPVHVNLPLLRVSCAGCGWVAAITDVQHGKYLARMHWSLMAGRDGR
jgi:hypothetical protein